MYTIADKLSQTLQNQGVINKEEQDICRYGLELAFLSVCEFASILLLAIFVGNFMQTLTFFIAFIPLRLYAGGYHADTRGRCYLVLLGVYFAFAYAMKVTPIFLYQMVEIATIIFMLFMVFCFAPIIHRNKKVTDIERYHYRKISLIIMAIEVGIIIFGMIFCTIKQYVFAFSLGQFTVAVSMLAALVKIRRGGERNERFS